MRVVSTIFKKNKLVKSIFIFFTLLFANITLAAEQTAKPITLNVPIAGVAEVSSFGKYFQLWYSFAIGAVGVLATVMIMWGGFKWLTSRGNSGVISESKQIIWSALIGVVLAFLSYTILYLINPQLTTIGLPTLETTNADIDGDADNDRDFLQKVAAFTYNNPTLDTLYTPVDVTVEWLIRNNDTEVLMQYLKSHKFSVTDSELISLVNGDINMANTTISGAARLGNSFGPLEAEMKDPNTFTFYPGQNRDIDTHMGQILSANPNLTTTNQSHEGWITDWTSRQYTNVNFQYEDSQGTIHTYPITINHNAEGENEWTVRFLNQQQ